MDNSVKDGWAREHLDKLDWVEVPMWKALKLWANNHKHVKCVEGNHYYFYHGQESMKKLSQSQVLKGVWYVEKM